MVAWCPPGCVFPPGVAVVHSGTLAGVANGRQGTVAFAFMPGAAVHDHFILRQDGTVANCVVTLAGAVNVTVGNPALGFSFDFVSPGGVCSKLNWNHVVARWDTNFAAGLKVGEIYVNGVQVPVGINSDTAPAFDIAYADATHSINWALGSFV